MASGDTCGGPCNGHYRRAMADYKDARAAWDKEMGALQPGDHAPVAPAAPETRPWLGTPVWCGRCTALIRRELAELDDAAAITAHTIDGHRGSTDFDDRVSGSRTASSPSPVSDIIDELASVLRGWESVHRGGDPKARRGNLATEITTTIAWLLAHFDPMITNSDYAGDYGSEIRSWHKRLTVLAKAGTGRSPRRLPCPRCHHKSLVYDPGGKHIECTGYLERADGRPADRCRKLISLDEYDALVDEQRKRQAEAAGRKKKTTAPPAGKAA